MPMSWSLVIDVAIDSRGEEGEEVRAVKAPGRPESRRAIDGWWGAARG